MTAPRPGTSSAWYAGSRLLTERDGVPLSRPGELGPKPSNVGPMAR
jgi:hypothetical protein